MLLETVSFSNGVFVSKDLSCGDVQGGSVPMIQYPLVVATVVKAYIALGP